MSDHANMKPPTPKDAPRGSLQAVVSLPNGARLEELKITIGQDSDCCADDELGNTLEIETPDGGGGKYITIKGRWAMDDENEIDALADMLKDVLRRAANTEPTGRRGGGPVR